MRSAYNRLFWFEWLFGLGGVVVFVALGAMAVFHRSITLGGRFAVNGFDGPVAVGVGFGLFLLAWASLRMLLRTNRFRRLWSALGLVAAIVLPALVYASGPGA